MYNLILKFLFWIHNFSYKLIGFFSIKENGGIHPKHKILECEKFFLDNIHPNENILDIGCGNGFLDFAIAQKASKVVGIDISKKNVDFAKKNFTKNNINYLIGDATTYPFEQKFDSIILSNVLEHINNRVDFLIKIREIAPKILIRVPLLSRDWLSVYKKEKGSEYRLDTTHFIEYTEETFRNEMEKADLKIESFLIKFGELYGVIKN